MGEAYTPPGSGDVNLDPGEGQEHEAPELEQEGEGEGEGEEGSEESEAKRWERQAHDKAGQAAKERSRRRAAERSLNELRGEVANLKQRMETSGGQDELVDLITGLRDDDNEPITDIRAIKAALKTFLARDRQEQQNAGQRQQHISRVNNISSNMSAFEADFVADHSDYMQAAEYLKSTRQEELEDMGYSGNALMSKLANEFFGLAEDAMNSGRDPAEVVYNMAKRRGFKSGQREADAKLQKLQRANGSAPGPGGGSARGSGESWMSVAKSTGSDFDKKFAALRKRELGKK